MASAVLDGAAAPKAPTVGLLDPKALEPPPKRLPPVDGCCAPKAGLFAPPNKLPPVLAVFPPKPPKPDELPAVAVLLPNRPPPELVLAPKAVVPPKGLDVDPVAPKPISLEYDLCHGLLNSIAIQAVSKIDTRLVTDRLSDV